MSRNEDAGSRAAGGVGVQDVEMKVEVVVIPVADADRAKEFYTRLGWRLDADFAFDNGFRVVQFTPPGSACSVQFGTHITSAAPGSAQGLYLVVPDIEAARRELAAHGAAVSVVFHDRSPGAQFAQDGADGRLERPAPDHASYGSFATFSDPDGNGWLLQEVTNATARACRAARPRPTRLWPTWRPRCGARRPPTANTSSASGSATRAGRTGTPPTWWRSRPGPSCRADRPKER